ncbi:MAG: DUF115 domain-containing protein [Spirochaetales bacterium]|nr:MAG: DUF115 domain-containing protein [Spirochaetales bacterium]
MNPEGNNLSLASTRFPELEAFLKADDGPDVDISVARSGEPTARLGGAWLHSRYDPRAEATTAADEILSAGAEFVVLIGLGLGYAAQALVAAGAGVLAVEVDPACLRACIASRDLSDLFGHERFVLVTGADTDALSRAIKRADPRSIAVLVNPAYRTVFPEQTAALQAEVDRFREKDRINEATLKRFGKRWVRNLAANAACIGDLPGVARLRGRFSGMPALVLAAGPSLDDVLPVLPELRDRAVVICVDTALRSALGAGIQPDFVVVVDPQYWNARHLDRCLSPQSILVTEAAVWPSVFRMPFRATYLCSSLYPLGRYLEARSGPPKGSLGAGGSVATSAWDFARLLGCAQIYLAGLDLSFPGGRTHARASFFEQRALGCGNRLVPGSHALFSAMRGGQPYPATANDGTRVISDRRLSLYSWWFSSRSALYPGTATMNMSEHGLAVPGLPYVPLTRLLRDKPVRGLVDNALADAVAEIQGADDTKGGVSLAIVMDSLLSELQVVASKAEAAADTVARARKLDGEQLDTVLQELGLLDRELMASAAKDVVGFLFASLEDLLGGRARSFQDSLDKSESLYREISASARWHVELLSREDT